MNSKLCIFLLGTAVLLSCVSNIHSAAIFAVPPPSVVTAHSSQVVARNYNGFAAAAVAAPLVAAAPAIAAPLAAAPVAAPLAAAPVAAPLAAYHVAYDGTYLI